MKNDEIFEIFSILSRVIIFIPVAVVFIALIYKFNQTPYNSKKERQNFIIPTIAPVSKIPNQTKINIDLKGPLVCQGSLDGLKVKIFLKDKKIRAITEQKNKKENFLLNDDCFYSWLEGEYFGEKKCGLAPIINIAEEIIGLNGVNLSLVGDQLAKFGIEQKIATDEAKISQLIKNCQKKEIASQTFSLPQNILFKNK